MTVVSCRYSHPSSSCKFFWLPLLCYHLFVPCSPKNIGETYELPQLPASDASIVQYNPAYGKNVPSRPDHVVTESNPAYGHFRSSRLEKDEEEEETRTYEPIPYDQRGH